MITHHETMYKAKRAEIQKITTSYLKIFISIENSNWYASISHYKHSNSNKKGTEQIITLIKEKRPIVYPNTSVLRIYKIECKQYGKIKQIRLTKC